MAIVPPGRRAGSARAALVGLLVIVCAMFFPGVAQAGPGQGVEPAGPGLAPAPDGVRVRLEHVVVRPARGGAGAGYDVLDVLRIEPQASPSGGGARPFTLPLPPGYENLTILGGFRQGTSGARPDGVAGTLDAAGEDGLVTVAVSYRLSAAQVPHPWKLARPYPVEAMVLLIHPQASLVVAGAEPAGSFEVEGVSYQAFLRQALTPDSPVMLAPVGSGGVAGRSGPGWGWLAGAAAAAVAVATGMTVRLRRRRLAGALAGGREVDRLADAVLALDAEYAAGYLEEGRYREKRQQMLGRIGALLAGSGARSEAAGD